MSADKLAELEARIAELEVATSTVPAVARARLKARNVARRAAWDAVTSTSDDGARAVAWNALPSVERSRLCESLGVEDARALVDGWGRDDLDRALGSMRRAVADQIVIERQPLVAWVKLTPTRGTFATTQPAEITGAQWDAMLAAKLGTLVSRGPRNTLVYAGGLALADEVSVFLPVDALDALLAVDWLLAQLVESKRVIVEVLDDAACRAQELRGYYSRGERPRLPPAPGQIAESKKRPGVAAVAGR